VQVREIIPQALPDVAMLGAIAREGLPHNYQTAAQRRAA